MVEPTEQEIEDLNRVALRVYGKYFDELCPSRQRTVIKLLQTGDF